MLLMTRLSKAQLQVRSKFHLRFVLASGCLLALLVFAHLAQAQVSAASCGLPASIGRAALKHSRRPRAASGTSPFDLAPGGVYQAARITPGAGGLLHHRFTLTSWPGRRPGQEAVCFLWHCPAGRPGSALPTTLPYGARTFLTGPCPISS